MLSSIWFVALAFLSPLHATSLEQEPTANYGKVVMENSDGKQNDETTSVRTEHQVARDLLAAQLQSNQSELERLRSQLLSYRSKVDYARREFLALNQRQKMDIQLIAVDAATATHKLKHLLEFSREYSGSGMCDGHAQQFEAISHRINLLMHQVRSQYHMLVKKRSAVADDLMKHIEQQKLASGSGLGLSPSLRNARISMLENILAILTSTIIQMAEVLPSHCSDIASEHAPRNMHADCLEKNQLVKDRKKKALRKARQSRYLEDMDTAASSSKEVDNNQDWVDSKKNRGAAQPARPEGLPKCMAAPASTGAFTDAEEPLQKPLLS